MFAPQTKLRLIPTSADQNPLAQSRRPMDMMVQGRSVSLFQAPQQWSTRSVSDANTRFESQLSRMNCQTFSAGLSSGHLGGSTTSVMLSGTTRPAERCHPAWSTTSTACLPGATSAAISARCRFIAGADSPEDVGGSGALIVRRRGPRSPSCPAPGDLVLLPDPGLVPEPDLYPVAIDPLVARDRVQALGERFLKASTAPAAWA